MGTVGASKTKLVAAVPGAGRIPRDPARCSAVHPSPAQGRHNKPAKVGSHTKHVNFGTCQAASQPVYAFKRADLFSKETPFAPFSLKLLSKGLMGSGWGFSEVGGGQRDFFWPLTQRRSLNFAPA